MDTKPKDKVALSYDVYQTENYDQFKYMTGNRKVDMTHVKRLAHKMQEEGNLMPERPVEVNENLFVIDGQNRIKAAELNKMPVYYRIIPNSTVSTTISFNTGTKNWGWKDFAESWKERGNHEYDKFLRLQEDSKLPFTIMLFFAGLGKDPRGVAHDKQYQSPYNDFKEGNFKFKNYELSAKLVRQYMELSAAADVYVREFAYAVYAIMRTPDYDHQALVEKIMLYGDGLHRCYTPTDFVMELENIQKA